MSLIWNLDLSTKVTTLISLFLFSISNASFGWIFFLFALLYFWSELEDDDIGDDLEEYIEFFLDECGLHDKWANNVIESLQKYEDLSKHYSEAYSDSYTDARNIFAKQQADTFDEAIDYDYYRENKKTLEDDLEIYLLEYLNDEDHYEYKYADMTEEQIKKFDTEETLYNSYANTSYIKYTNKDDVSVKKGYDYDDIDVDFGDYVYIYKIAEQYYEWFHTTSYPTMNNTIADWEELFLEKLMTQYDKKIKGKINEEHQTIMSRFLVKKNTKLFNNNYWKFYHVDKRHELFVHPYPIWAKKDDNYHLLFRGGDRWRNGVDYALMKNLYYYTDLNELNKILLQQKFIDEFIKNDFKIL